MPASTFSAILAELRTNRSEEARNRAAREAHQFIAFQAREMSSEAFTKFLASLSASMASLAASNVVGDRLACLALIEELIQLDLGDGAVQYSSHLRALLSSQDTPVLQAAARVLGVLLSRWSTGTALLDEVEYETQRALEWLEVEKSEARRLGAVLILKVLADRAPTHYYAHVATFFERVWIALRDAKLHIRLAAVDALRSTLLLVKGKDTRMKVPWYKQLNENAQKALKLNASTESVHGALLVLVELAENCNRHFDNALKEFCDIMFRHKEHKDKVVRRATLSSLPRLAALQPEMFAHDYLNTFINFVFANLEKGKSRRSSYLALGDLASAVGGHIKPYVDIVMQHFQSGLANKKLKKTHQTAIITSMGRLAPAAGALLAPYVSELLPSLFAAGLSPTLVDSLTLLSRHVPASVLLIRQRLLSVLSMLLAGEPFRHVENAVYPRKVDAPIVTNGQPVEEDQIVFALRTLRTFDFSSVSLLDFLCRSVSSYLKSESAVVRTEAVLACGEGGRIHAQRVNVHRVQQNRVTGVEQIVSLLLGVAVTDSDPFVRHSAASVLTAPYDTFLCQADHVSSLCVALQDELFETREAVLLTLSRLAPRNPAVVFPVLRGLLLRLLSELDLTEDGRVREESARLVAHLMSCGSGLIRPYVECIVRVLLKRMPDNNTRVSSSCLVALGQMAVVSGSELRPRIDSLLSVVISFVRDPTAGSKREVALQVLGQLAQACPSGPTPLQKYPELLDSILQDLKSDESPVPRREILRVLGILGALDPYRRLQAKPQAVNTGKSSDETKSLVLQEDELYAQVGATAAEDHAPCAAIAAVVRVLRDAALGAVHPFAVQALVSIATSMEARLAPYLPYILPAWLSLIRSLDPSSSAVEVQLLQLAAFVHVLRLHLAENVKELCELVKSYWTTQLLAALKLLESCAIAFQSLLLPFVPALTVLITNVLRNDYSPSRLQRVQRVLDILLALSPLHEPQFHLIAPVLASIICSDVEPADVKRAAIRAIGLLAYRIDLTPHVARLLVIIARALPQKADLKPEGVAAISAMFETCSVECRRFQAVVTRCLADAQIKSDDISRVVAKLDQTQVLKNNTSYLAPDLHEEPPLNPPTRQPTGEAPRRAAEASMRYSKDDWAAWFRRLTIELLKDSSSPELASCLPVAQAHPPLSRELFNVAFFSVWLQLDQESRIRLKALDSPNTPADLMQALLSLAEFMEQHEQNILIDQSKLSSLAERCKAHAKALRYKEAEMRAGNCSSGTIESLISINNQLGQRDSAMGILRFAQQQGIQLKESSYEKLQRWEEALKVYEQRQAEDPLNVDFTLGRMRCLAALGEWERLGSLASNTWRTVQEKFRPLIAPLCAEAAWNLAKWEEMASYVQAVDSKRVEGSLYRAILAVRKLEWEEAQRCINKARDTLAAEVSVLLQESYERAYSMIVTVQQLSELEEIMQAKRSPDRRLHLRSLWKQRLLGVETEPDTWQRLLAVRSLLLAPQDDLEVWIKAASLYKKNGQVQLALKTVHSLLAREKAAGLAPDPHLQFARLKLYWENNEGTRSDAIIRLHQFTNQLRKSPQKDNRLLAKCYLRLGRWQRSVSEALEELAIPEIVNTFRQATDVMPLSAKAWRAWGLVNFEVVSKYEGQSSRADLLSIHLGPALDGFFRTVALAPQDSLQHLLRVLTLWFKHGHMMEVEAAILSGLSRVSVDNWLQVIPQLIARIHTPVPQVRKGVQDLLSTLGKIHPHALVWPLTVASKSNSRSRQLAAQGILGKMRQHSPQLVDQALLVSEELIRVAILWPEMWQEGLEEASRFYFGEHNVEGMFSTLAPLYALLAKGPRTENETNFYQTYARELQEAEECCKRYAHNQNEDELNQAWDVYYNVFKKIGKQLPTITSLELGHCSPALLTAADLQLAVPGTYEAGKEVVKIRRITPVLKVISSKQRPRKLLVSGSDGCDYTFLLKGHEDLRQDERVMQLFGLVNTLLQSDDFTAKAHLSIQRYSVIPLSPNSGLIGCDTLHTVLRDYREARNIPLNLEHKWMQQMIADYDKLTLMQKLEVFRYSLENTSGDDLNKILWLKSRNSEAWLARRTVYTRSLALMSMVGYILGLGDRHPSNLMLERTTGKVIHIDFGDCFEVAMQREKYPERIPFRLTRMLICAMEPSGVEGAFRVTCEAVLRLLRQNKESLMAVLEAFVYDPLINWRLLSGSSLQSGSNTSTGALTALPSLEFDPSDPQHAVGSVSSIWSASAASSAANSVVSRTIGPISYSPSPARQTSLSLRATNMPPNGRPATEAPPRRPQPKTLASDVESVSARPQEALNEKAVTVMNRISNKLTGKDFGPQPIDVPTQVQRLIDEATSAENLCQCYIGWCPFW